MKKYEIVFKDLEAQILNQHLPVGAQLPTELALTQHYQASRDTVRKALKKLVELGLIERQQGRGSRVCQRSQVNFPVSQLTTYTELMTSLGIHSQTKLIGIDKVIVDQQLAELTGFAPKSLVWRLTRQRVVNGLAAVVDTDYLLKSLVPELTPSIAQGSLYQHLEQVLQLSIAQAQKEITIDHVTDKDRLLLTVGKDQHVVSVKSKTFLTDGRQFQFTESRHKLDQFKFVDLAVRKPL